VSKFNVGDLVFHYRRGWIHVTEVQDKIFFLRDLALGFHLCGRLDLADILPSVFTKEEALVIFPEFPPPKQTRTVTEAVFINKYPCGEIDACRTKKEADELAETWGRIACVETTVSYEVEE
jgi:hypothetical protein